MVGRLVSAGSSPDARVAPLHMLHTVGGWLVGVCVCVHILWYVFLWKKRRKRCTGGDG